MGSNKDSGNTNPVPISADVLDNGARLVVTPSASDALPGEQIAWQLTNTAGKFVFAPVPITFSDPNAPITNIVANGTSATATATAGLADGSEYPYSLSIKGVHNGRVFTWPPTNSPLGQYPVIRKQPNK